MPRPAPTRPKSVLAYAGNVQTLRCSSERRCTLVTAPLHAARSAATRLRRHAQQRRVSEANPNANYSYSLRRLMHPRLRLHNEWMSFHSMASSLHARGKVQSAISFGESGLFSFYVRFSVLLYPQDILCFKAEWFIHRGWWVEWGCS